MLKTFHRFHMKNSKSKTLASNKNLLVTPRENNMQILSLEIIIGNTRYIVDSRIKSFTSNRTKNIDSDFKTMDGNS